MKTKKILLIISVLMLSLFAVFTLTACNKYFFEDLAYLLTKDDAENETSTSSDPTDPGDVGQTDDGYSISMKFDDDNPIENAGYSFIMTISIEQIETKLVVENDEYVLSKIMKGMSVVGSEDYITNPDYECTNYAFYFDFTYRGSCTVNGNTITLQVPTSGTKIAYYVLDVNKLYPSVFPITATAEMPTDGNWEGIKLTPVDLIEKDYQFAYFGNLFIEKSSECKTQIATIDGNKLVSIVGDPNATAVELLTKEETEKGDDGQNGTSDEPQTLLTLQREGADCKLFFFEEGKFIFDYNGVVSEEGEYVYENGALTMTAAEGATVTVTESEGTITIAYVASVGGGALHDEFTIKNDELDAALNTVKVLFKLQREGADCTFTMYSDNSFVFDYNGMVQEKGTYSYENATLTVSAMEGATVTVTEKDGTVSIYYVASVGGGMLYDTFTIEKTALESKLS